MPVYPALFIAAGYAVLALVGEPSSRVMTLAGAGATLLAAVGLGAIGAYIYFDRTEPTSDGLVRQALAKTVGENAGSETRLVLPFLPNASDPVDLERYDIRFMVAGAYGGFDNVDSHYSIVPYAKLLSALESGHERQVVFILDGELSPALNAARTAGMQAIRRCYSSSVWSDNGKWTTATVQRADDTCHISGPITLGKVTSDVTNQRTTLTWDAPNVAAPLEITVERKASLVEGYEMESFAPNGGWFDEDHTVKGYSGTGYFSDSLGAQTAIIPITVPADASYSFWLRTMRRRADDTRWLVSVDGQHESYISPLTDISLNEWKWERVGPFDLATGQHKLTFTRQGTGWSVFIDLLYVSRNPQFDPRVDPLWAPALNGQVFTPNGPDDHSLVLAGLSPGVYRWRVASMAAGVIDGAGDQLKSADQEFEVP